MSVANVVIAGRYRLLSLLGKGGMGRVWLALDEMLGRDVAVKEVVLPEDLGSEDREELLRRTLREARAAARLSHPNVVQIYDVLYAQGRPWIVMEYVRARSLQEVIKEDGPLPVPWVARIGLAILDALGAAHRAGVLHRDVKPGNVLIAKDGRVVLTDFGLAIFDGGEGTVTRAGLVLGSPQYISPERASDGASSPESDLWSLGATLYAAVEGHAPFARATTMATLTALATAPLDRPQRAGALEPVLEGLLRKDPRARVPAAEADRLLRGIAAEDAGPPGLRSPMPRVPRPRVPRPRVPILRIPSQRSPGQSEAASTATIVRTPERVGGVQSAVLGADPVADAPTAVVLAGTPQPGAMETERLFVPAPAAGRLTGLRTSRRRLWKAAIVAVVAMALVFLLSYGAQRRQAAQQPAGAFPSQTVEGSPFAAVPAPTRSDESALPEGWFWYHDVSGYAIAAPMGWTATRTDSTVYFREPGGARLLRVDRWTTTERDLVSALTRIEAQHVDAHQLPNYQRIQIESRPEYFQSCAVWEYAYDSTGSGRLHAMELRFTTSPAQGYTIAWITRTFDWQVNQANLLLITASFHPAG